MSSSHVRMKSKSTVLPLPFSLSGACDNIVCLLLCPQNGQRQFANRGKDRTDNSKFKLFTGADNLDNNLAKVASKIGSSLKAGVAPGVLNHAGAPDHTPEEKAANRAADDAQVS